MKQKTSVVVVVAPVKRRKEAEERPSGTLFFFFFFFFFHIYTGMKRAAAQQAEREGPFCWTRPSLPHTTSFINEEQTFFGSSREPDCAGPGRAIVPLPQSCRIISAECYPTGFPPSLSPHPFLPFYLFVNPAADASEKEEEEKGVGWEKPRLLEMQQMRLSLSLVLIRSHLYSCQASSIPRHIPVCCVPDCVGTVTSRRREESANQRK